MKNSKIMVLREFDVLIYIAHRRPNEARLRDMPILCSHGSIHQVPSSGL